MTSTKFFVSFISTLKDLLFKGKGNFKDVLQKVLKKYKGGKKGRRVQRQLKKLVAVCIFQSALGKKKKVNKKSLKQIVALKNSAQ